MKKEKEERKKEKTIKIFFSLYQFEALNVPKGSAFQPDRAFLGRPIDTKGPRKTLALVPDGRVVLFCTSSEPNSIIDVFDKVLGYRTIIITKAAVLDGKSERRVTEARFETKTFVGGRVYQMAFEGRVVGSIIVSKVGLTALEGGHELVRGDTNGNGLVIRNADKMPIGLQHTGFNDCAS